ncbi:MAG: type I glyceraldehyde-3-phosphate dehydrogenase [Candidatus Vogelbacteria bacterium]|nr:type I glyceraldehyde-3-phosphate dehydrogenase [Candidatus Vogelbacteria bacterium]
MKKIRVAVNGLGRIGRAFLKLAITRPELELVAINDLADIDNLAYLLKYDTVYGGSGFDIKRVDSFLHVNKQSIKICQEKNPADLPWADLHIDVAVESTGVFETYEKARAHLRAGAKRVVISAPIKDEPPQGVRGATVLMGINDEALAQCDISSNASCTTNAASPVMRILNDAFGIEKAMLSTVHGYTASQKIVDGPDAKDWRRGRAAAQNIVPSTTGAAIAVTKAMPELEGNFDGIAFRVPVVTGSIADITAVMKREVTSGEVNRILKEAASETRWKGIYTTTEDPIVSSDIIGSPYAAIADLSFTKVVGGNLLKVLSWYDNEMGYTYTLVEHVIKSGRYLS